PDGSAHVALVQAVSDPDPHVGAWAIMALRNASLPIPVAVLAALVDSPGWSIEERAIEALGPQRDAPAGPLPADPPAQDGTPALRRKAAEALGRLAQYDVDLSLAPLTAALLSDADAGTRRAAFDALLSLGERTPVGDLLAALDDADPFVRQHVIEQLLGQ